MNNKEEYATFCKTEKSLPIFWQPWYLDAVCQEGEWDVVLAKRDNNVIAVMPFFLKQKLFFKYITKPHLCPYVGPYITPSFRRLKQEHKILKELIGQLPSVDFFSQNFHYTIQNYLPFYWEKFKQKTNYTYLIDTKDLDKAWQNVYNSYRRQIKTAQKKLKIVSDLGVEDFFKVCKMTFDRQGISLPFSFDFFKQVHEAIQKNNAGKLFFAVDEKKQIHSVFYLVWDDQYSYNLFCGDDPSLRKSGAPLLLAWEVIRYTKENLGLDTHDALGSMLKNIEPIRRNFGGIQQAYFNIQKNNSFLFWLINKIK